MSDRPAESKTNQPFEYVVGGSLPLDAVSYVKRSADDEFYAGLKAGKFCYVLNSRQMGKSSLRVRTMARLQADGIVCVSIDMTAIGSAEVTAEQWYLGVLWAIVKQVREHTAALESWKLPTLRAWWMERNGLSFVQRWGEFLSMLLLEVGNRIVIFVDEIDSVLGLGFRTDDFFAAIRECYNRRVDDNRYERLTFGLLGVCAPQDLIQDKRRTPFNIGQAIELSGFSYEEAISLVKGLPGGEETLQSVLGWTGGQPFLTQRVCRLVREEMPPNTQFLENINVDDLVKSRIIRVWESQDEQVHFQTIGDRMMADASLAGAMLGMYQRVLVEGDVGIDGSAEQIALRLTGAVVKKGSHLVVANQIYAQVFGDSWVSKKLNLLRPYAENLQKWMNGGDESALLRGENLRLARLWADREEQKLAPEDYRFLQASQDLERSFKFKNGSALNVYELVQLCEKDPKEAEKYLRNGDLRLWLSGSLGEPSLADIADEVKKNYARDSEQSLEMFIRALYEHLNSKYNGNPQLILKPENLNIGKISIGSSREVTIETSIINRGFVWGQISYKSESSGITILDKKFDSRKSNKIIIDIALPSDIKIVKSGKYYFHGNLKLEGLEKGYDFKVEYEVIPVSVKITPNQIQLGLIRRLGRVRRGEILIELQKEENLKISGYVISSDPSMLQISSSVFTASKSIEYRISFRNSVVGLIKTEIRIEINGEKIIIPVSFVAEIDYVYLFLSYFPMSIGAGLVAGITRHIIDIANNVSDLYSLIAILVILGITFIISAFINYNRDSMRKLNSDRGISSQTQDGSMYSLIRIVLRQLFIIPGSMKSNKAAIRKISLKRNTNLALKHKSISALINLSSFFTGMLFSWLIAGMGILSQIGSGSVFLIDFISNIFYVIGMESIALRWTVFVYAVVNIYFISTARRKMRMKTNKNQ